MIPIRKTLVIFMADGYRRPRPWWRRIDLYLLAGLICTVGSLALACWLIIEGGMRI